MPNDDELTPTWNKETSFVRKASEPDGTGDPVSEWEQELSRWSTPEEQPQTPDVDPTAAELPSLPEAVDEPDDGAPIVQLPTPSVPLPAVPPAGVPDPPVEPPAAVAEPPVVALPDPEPELDDAAPANVLPEFAAKPEPATNVPFYKRELSLKRTPRDKKPKIEKPRRERKPKRAIAEAEERNDAEVKVPFYKRELSLKRTKPARTPVTERPQKSARPERTKSERPKLRRPALPRPEIGGGGKNAKKFVGLKIGASQIAAARIVNAGGSPQLLQAVSSPLEPGVVVGGELRDPEALAVALREFFKQHNLPRKGIRLGIANNRIGVRTLDVVGIQDPKQLENAVKFRAQEVLPIPIEDAVLDYQVLSESVDADGQPSSRVLLVVAYKDLVDRYVDACRNAGLQIVGIDLEAFALLRALAEPQSELQPLPGMERGALVAVAVGHDRSTFAISDGRVCEFTRVLQWGGWSLNVAIARALDTSPSEAEVVKRALSFAGPEEPPQGFNADQMATAREAARTQLQTFARELVSSLQFYQNQPASLGIGEIVVTGGTSHLPGFGAELERLVGVPVRIGDPLSRLKLAKGVGDLERVGSLAVAIGLGIED